MSVAVCHRIACSIVRRWQRRGGKRERGRGGGGGGGERERERERERKERLKTRTASQGLGSATKSLGGIGRVDGREETVRDARRDTRRCVRVLLLFAESRSANAAVAERPDSAEL